MRLVVTVDGTAIEFVQPGADGEYPWLVQTGTLLLAARAGHLSGIGIGESANMTAGLINTNREAAGLLGYCLRAAAEYYDDDDELLFSGLVQQIALGGVMTLTIEA